MQLLGVDPFARVLHVCGGRVRDYHSGPTKGKGLGRFHRTIDIDPAVKPDFLMDVRKLGVGKGDLFPLWTPSKRCQVLEIGADGVEVPDVENLWDAVLIDRPYTEEDATHYAVQDVFPANLNDLLKRSLSLVKPGGRVGVIDYLWPMPPGKLGWLPRLAGADKVLPGEFDDECAALIAKIGVSMGWNNRERTYVVYERLFTEWEQARWDDIVDLRMDTAKDLDDTQESLSKAKEKIEELEGKIEDDLYTEEEYQEGVREAVELRDEFDFRPLIVKALDAGISAHDLAGGVSPELRDLIYNVDLTRAGGTPGPKTPLFTGNPLADAARTVGFLADKAAPAEEAPPPPRDATWAARAARQKAEKAAVADAATEGFA